MNPLRVLVGMPFGSMMGGAERYLDLVARQAAAHGLDVHVVFEADGPFPADLAAAGVRTSIVPFGRFREVGREVRGIDALRRIVRRERPDVVFGWHSRSHVHLGPAALLAGVPRRRIAWWQHHAADPGDGLERAATRVPAAAIFCASETVMQAQGRLRPPRPLVLTRYGIAPVQPRPADEIAALRAQMGIPGERFVAGIPGRLVRWKGQDRFLRAVALLAGEGRDVHGLVVGGTGHGLDEDFAPELHALVGELGIGERVTFTGQVADPVPYLQAMDVVVNASVPEPFGLTIVEAHALAVPALGVDVGGARETITHGTTGWLAATGEPADLAAGMAALMDDPAAAQRMAQAGRAAYEDTYTADAGVARFAAAVRALVT